MKRSPGEKGRIRSRVPNAKYVDEIKELLDEEPRSRDMLIEYLHKIQDLSEYYVYSCDDIRSGNFLSSFRCD